MYSSLYSYLYGVAPRSISIRRTETIQITRWEVLDDEIMDEPLRFPRHARRDNHEGRGRLDVLATTRSWSSASQAGVLVLFQAHPLRYIMLPAGRDSKFRYSTLSQARDSLDYSSCTSSLVARRQGKIRPFKGIDCLDIFLKIFRLPQGGGSPKPPLARWFSADPPRWFIRRKTPTWEVGEAEQPQL